MDIQDIRRKQMAEEATGTRSVGPLKFYLSEFEIETYQEKILEALMEGRSVEVPGASAGSVYGIMDFLGVGEVTDYDTSSSAGDWSFILPGLDKVLVQTNRYPYHGFRYEFVDFDGKFADFDDTDDDNEERNEMTLKNWIVRPEALREDATLETLVGLLEYRTRELMTNLGPAVFVDDAGVFRIPSLRVVFEPISEKDATVMALDSISEQ